MMMSETPAVGREKHKNHIRNDLVPYDEATRSFHQPQIDNKGSLAETSGLD